MSFGDEELDTEPSDKDRRVRLTQQELELINQRTWTVDELVRIAFIAKRLAARCTEVDS